MPAVFVGELPFVEAPHALEVFAQAVGYHRLVGEEVGDDAADYSEYGGAQKDWHAQLGDEDFRNLDEGGGLGEPPVQFVVRQYRLAEQERPHRVADEVERQVGEGIGNPGAEGGADLVGAEDGGEDERDDGLAYGVGEHAREDAEPHAERDLARAAVGAHRLVVQIDQRFFQFYVKLSHQPISNA